MIMKTRLFTYLSLVLALMALNACASMQAANNQAPAPSENYTPPAAGMPEEVASLQSIYSLQATFDQMGREVYKITVPAYQMQLVFTLSGELLELNILDRGQAVLRVKENDSQLVNLPAANK